MPWILLTRSVAQISQSGRLNAARLDDRLYDLDVLHAGMFVHIESYLIRYTTLSWGVPSGAIQPTSPAETFLDIIYASPCVQGGRGLDLHTHLVA